VVRLGLLLLPARTVRKRPAAGLSRWASELTYVSRFAAIILVIAFSCPISALACDCGLLDLPHRFASADLVLVAKVSSVKALDYVTVSPVEVFKGSASGTLTIQTGRSDCDFFLPPVSPKLGEEYLLYLRESAGQLTANRCFAPGPTAEKAMEMRELRQHFKPGAQPDAARDAR
jgi:hypothetical protein